MVESQTRAPSTHGRPPRARKARILIVEDNIDDARLIIRAIGRMKERMDVEVVPDGQSAIDHLCVNGRGKRLPDLVVLDWKLPLVRGAEVLKRIRATKRCRGVIVVAFSSSDMEHDHEECYRLGGNGFVTKPIDYDEFMNAVQGLVANFAPRPPAAKTNALLEM